MNTNNTNTTSSNKKVAIIGSGPCGLVALKESLVNGLQPVVFEKASQYGGLWRTEDGYVYNNLTCNFSKFQVAFSDFEYKDYDKVFASGNEFRQYIRDYVEHFKLQKHIRLSCPVTRVSRKGEGYRITYSENNTIQKSEDFDFLIWATGNSGNPYIPQIKGLDKFKGKVIHSAHYKKPQDYKNMKVAVIGSSISSPDIASEIAREAKGPVYSYMKKPYFYIDYNPNGPVEGSKVPADFLFAIRKLEYPAAGLSAEQYNGMLQDLMKSISNNDLHPSLHKEPTTDFPQVAPTKTFCQDVKDEKIILKAGKFEFNEKGIIYEDGTVEEFDAVVFGTGYRCNFSMFDEDILKDLEYDFDQKEEPVLLYDYTFNPKVKNAAFMGISYLVFYTLFELQARWATLLFSGKVQYPSEEYIKEKIEAKRQFRLTPNKDRKFELHSVSFDQIAKQIGCLPDFDTLKDKNPELYEKIWNFSNLSVHYRLFGPHSNQDQAMRTINKFHDVFERMMQGKLKPNV